MVRDRAIRPVIKHRPDLRRQPRIVDAATKNTAETLLTSVWGWFSLQKFSPWYRLKKPLIATCMMVKSRRTRSTRLGEKIMSKIASVVGVVAVAAATLGLPAPVRAENGQIAAGVVGGLIGGALLGGALASRPAPPPPVYYAPAPVYVEEPACRFVRERYWDGYGWVYRRVEVCD